MAGSRQSLRVVPDDESLASRLRRQRQTDDLTQAELGKRLGVSQQTIGAWERGERPQNGKLDVLAEYLGTDKRQLLLLIDGQPSWLSGQGHVNGAEVPIDSEPAEESADSNDAMMRQLAKRFMEAEKQGPLSSQRAEAYRTLFEYFGRNTKGAADA